MPRAIWSGAISFGLVNVPVRLFSAVQQHDVQFHMVHAKDGSRIGYEKYCKKEGKKVPADQIVKAYEMKGGKLVYLEDSDFEAAQTKGYHTIELTDFVPHEQIDPIYFEHTYYVGPQDGSEQVYALLAKALERSGLAGVGTFVMRERQYLGCVRIRDGLVVLEQMYFADEIRDVGEVKPSNTRVDKGQLDMAVDLIERLSGDFKPSRYKDTYHDALMKVIRRKSKGKQVRAPEPEPEEEPQDLMAALMESLERHRTGGKSSNGRKRHTSKRSDVANGSALGELSKEELLARAAKADVPGRSTMTKRELVKALS